MEIGKSVNTKHSSQQPHPRRRDRPEVQALSAHSSICLRGQLAKQDLLILDKLGYVPASKVGAELLFDIISTGLPSIVRSERLAKYNRLLRIEEELQHGTTVD